MVPAGNKSKHFLLLIHITKTIYNHHYQKRWQLGIVKSIHKGEVKENIQKNQKGVFLEKKFQIYMKE